MPLYEYRCRECGHSFKQLFLIVDDALFVCPKCGDNKEKKLLNYISLTSDKGIGIYFSYSPKEFSFPLKEKTLFDGWLQRYTE